MRKMGGLRQLLPFTYAMMFIGSLALMGFPFLTGFYSKDVILEVAFARYTSISQFAYWLGTFAAFCTAFYSLRLLYLTFLANPNGKRVVIENAHESRSEEHTSELQSLMRISYAVFCLKKKKNK